MKKAPKALSLFWMATVLGGCGINTIEQKTNIMTGLFKTPVEAREKAKNLEKDKTPCPEGLKAAGFDPDAPNVEKLPGAKGVKHFLGTDNPQVTVTKPEDVEKIYQEFARFLTLLYPITNPHTDKDMAYLNRQDSVTTGTRGEYFIVCRDGRVGFHDFNGKEKLNETAEHKQTGGNVLQWFLGILGNPLGLIR